MRNPAVTKPQPDRAYQRDASFVTDRSVAPARPERRRPRWGKGARQADQLEHMDQAGTEAAEVVATYQECVGELRRSLPVLAGLERPRLLGKVEEEQARVERAAAGVEDAVAALGVCDLGGCGKAIQRVQRELTGLGNHLSVALNHELARAAVSGDSKAALQANLERRRAAHQMVGEAEHGSPRASLLAWAAVHRATAETWSLAAGVLRHQAPPKRVRATTKVDGDVRLVPPQELETFADVGGLGEAKEYLRRTIGRILEGRPAGGAGAGVPHNGILLYGPPGTGKSLLARAVAGEYGLKLMGVSPAVLSSAYQHEPAKKLRRVFALAAEAAPCLLFLDDVDALAGRRDDTSPDRRDLAAQLVACLEEYRESPALVIMAASSEPDHLDPALREGRFDSRLALALPDADARRAILEVHLERRGGGVAWDTIDLDALGARTAGRSGATLASLVAGAAERAHARGGPITHDDVVAEIEARSGRDRLHTVEDPITWDDVVLPAATRTRLEEILLVFERPELGRSLGIRAPAGILLHGPPGTGKTTIAKALATRLRASFYEQSAADLLSKWVGESEQKVAQLFARARANRPSIIFCDEIDALVKRRSADSTAPWEERVVSQFLRELDGLQSGEGVLLVGATNRPDMIDEAVRERRLVPLEIPLPDEAGRRRVLEVVCRDVRLAPDVDPADIARVTAGMSGADLKALRNRAGMRAVSRAATNARTGAEPPAVRRADFAAVLAEQGVRLPRRRRPPEPTNPPAPDRRPGNGTVQREKGEEPMSVTVQRRSRR